MHYLSTSQNKQASEEDRKHRSAILDHILRGLTQQQELSELKSRQAAKDETRSVEVQGLMTENTRLIELL